MSRFRNFSRQAAVDLDGIVGWMLDHGNAAGVAERLLAAVLAAGGRLAERPLPGRHRPDLLPGLTGFGPSRATGCSWCTDPTTNPATILRVLNTAQDLLPLLAELRGHPEEPER